MKTIFTATFLMLFSIALNAQMYDGTLQPTTPSPGNTVTVNFALTSGSAMPNLIIYAYNSFTKLTVTMPTTATFNNTGYYGFFTVPMGTPNNTIMQFTIGTNSATPTYYGVVTSATVLPIIFESFTATLSGTDKAILKWEIESTDNSVINNSIVYRSLDGTSFVPLDTVKGSATQTSYTYTDALNASSNNYFYKVACVGKDGDKTISSTVLVNTASQVANSFKILNSANITNQIFISGINLNLYKQSDVNIYDALGRRYNSTIQSNNTINANSLKTGIYYLKIANYSPVNFIVK